MLRAEFERLLFDGRNRLSFREVLSPPNSSPGICRSGGPGFALPRTPAEFGPTYRTEQEAHALVDRRSLPASIRRKKRCGGLRRARRRRGSGLLFRCEDPFLAQRTLRAVPRRRLQGGV